MSVPSMPVLQVADPHAARPPGADLQHGAGLVVDQAAGPGADRGLQHAQVAVEPAGDAHLPGVQAQAPLAGLVHLGDHLAEAGLDGLAPQRALGRQLAPVGGEVPVQDREVDHAFEGRQVAVGRGHDAQEVLAPALLAVQRVQHRVLLVGHDQQGVVAAPVAGQEGALDAGHALEQRLDPARGDGLAPVVLVDVLDPVDDLHLPAGRVAEEVARGQPVLVAARVGHRQVAGRAVLGQVAGDVDAGDLQLVLLAEAHLDPGQGDAHRVLLVVVGRGHGQAAGALGHAEAAAQAHALAVEEAEHLRVQPAGGRQPPVQAIAHHRAQDLRRLAAARLLARQFEGAVADLHPAHRHADQAGGPHLGQLAQQGVGRGAAGEDVGAPPEDGAQHLQVAAEGVEEGKVAEQHLVAADEGQGRGAGEALADQVQLGEDHALGPSGAAGGEHHRGRVAHAQARAGRQRRLDLRRRQQRQPFVQRQDPRRVDPVGRVQGEDAERFAALLAHRQQAFEAVGIVADGGGDPQAVEDPDHVLDAGVHVQRRDRDVVAEAGQVRAGGADAVGVEEGHAQRPHVVGGGPALAQEDRRGAAHPVQDALVAPGAAVLVGQVAEEVVAALAAGPGRQQVADGVVDRLDHREGDLGPAQPGRRVGQPLQEVGVAGQVQEAAPVVPVRRGPVAAGQGVFGSLQQRQAAGRTPVPGRELTCQSRPRRAHAPVRPPSGRGSRTRR